MPVHATNSSGCFSEIKKSGNFKEMILFITIVLKFHINMIILKEDSQTHTFVFEFWFGSFKFCFCCSTIISPTLDYSGQFLAFLKSCETQDKFGFTVLTPQLLRLLQVRNQSKWNPIYGSRFYSAYEKYYKNNRNTK